MARPDEPRPDAADSYPATPASGRPRPISPTDVSQFIRLDQCQRYLRLRLHGRIEGERFLRDYGVEPQEISPLLTRSGASFEEAIVAMIRTRFRVVNLREVAVGREPDNERVVALARDLPPGEVLVLFQPRLNVSLGDWRLRGDADLVRLEQDSAGHLRILIVDVKSSTAAKIEHRLQVAFYDRMVASLLEAADVPCASIDIGILYRTGNEPPVADHPRDQARIERERQLADELLGVTDALLEVVANPGDYRRSVSDLVTGPESVAERVATAPFADVPYHLTFKCDGCLYNEFCMKWSAERDDLSLLPYVTEHEKRALHEAGVRTVREVSRLKQPRVDEITGAADARDLVPVPETRATVNQLGATWPIGPRLDELIHRARSYRGFKGDPVKGLSFIPSKGYGSLPYVAADHNPNLIRVYIDAQHDYLFDRLYMIGALVVGAAGGDVDPRRRRVIVELADQPPDTPEIERLLLVRWIEQTLRAVVEVAAPDENGEARAPIHLIFYERYDQRVLMDALSRHAESVLAATPMYDFMTQMAAFDSPIATFLTEEIRELKNYPMVSQSLQAVAGYLRFDWSQETNYRNTFRAGMFDFWGKIDDPDGLAGKPVWYFNRARFSSQIPLEFAYVAWDAVEQPVPGERDLFTTYRGVTPELLVSFQQRRLEAMEHIAGDFSGNKNTVKGSFDLPDLSAFEDKARNLADALDEFMTIERHVTLSQWKNVRLQPPERRVLSGDTLVVRYVEADQAPGIAALNRENERLRQLREEYRAAWKEAHPEAKKITLPKEQREESAWSQQGLKIWLRIETDDIDATLDQILGLSKLREGESVLLHPRWSVDGRLPEAEQVDLQPTARQMLYWGQQATIQRLRIDRDAEDRALAAWVEVELSDDRSATSRGFVFPRKAAPLTPGEPYTLDEDPNNWNGAHQRSVVEGLKSGGRNMLYDRLRGATDLPARATWPEEAAAGQRRFVDGLAALDEAGALHPFSTQVREYLGQHGATPILLVQGPPGTGKSYTTAFALYARMQGAMAAGIDWRVIVCCNTHSATDVLLTNIAEVQEALKAIRESQPAIFATYFDERLLRVALFRIRPRDALPAQISLLYRKEDRPPGQMAMADEITRERWSIAAGTPAGVRNVIVDRWNTKELFDHRFIDGMVLDEASRISLPEAIMATLPLKPDGQLIVVGDHRQMPPIVQHDWSNERRRSFQDYQTYESLFDTLRDRGVPGQAVYPMIQFDESFRLHTDMAEFLRREIYRHDGIPYHSRRTDVLPPFPGENAFVQAVLTPDHPLVVVVHDERRSQQRNPFEQTLITPVLQALADQKLDPEHGLGVVVLHRAQRAALQQAVPDLSRIDPESGMVTISAVDTVERYQGGERQVMIVSATESDPAYVLSQSKFLLDPRRLTVALSRAKQKMILVAARSIFEIFSPDEDVFANAQLWKNLLHETCTVVLWRGEVDGIAVEVRGNGARVDPARAFDMTPLVHDAIPQPSVAMTDDKSAIRM